MVKATALLAVLALCASAVLFLAGSSSMRRLELEGSYVKLGDNNGFGTNAAFIDKGNLPEGMHDNTRARWHESHEVGEAPSKATVDVWAREYEGIKDVNPYGIDMRYWIPGPLHKARARC